jgi:hypothetical protein
MVRLVDMVQQVPSPVQAGLNWGSIGGAVSSFFGFIQGPLAAVASLLSIVWLSLQIYSWVEKRRKRGG